MFFPSAQRSSIRAWRISLGEARRNIRHGHLAATAYIMIIGMVLLTAGGMRLAAENLDRLTSAWGRGVQMIVYLDDNVAPARMRQIADTLAQLGGVGAVRMIEPKEAHARLRRSLGDRARLLEGIEETMLPASLEIVFREGRMPADKLHPMVERIRRVAGVEDIELMDNLLERVEAAKRFLASTWAVAGVMVFVIGLLLASRIGRLSTPAERDYVYAARLSGADAAFFWRPALLQGTIVGLAGSVSGLLLLGLLYVIARPAVEHILGATLAAVPLAFLSSGAIALAVAAGLAIALVGSFSGTVRNARL